MRALVTGATGFIGRPLLSKLDAAAVLTRDPERARRSLPGADAHAWAPEVGPPPDAAFRGVDVVFNLAGEPVAEGRWTAERKRRIRDSRVLGTRNLVAGLAAQASRPRVLVSASAVGYYGDRGDEELDEGSAAGSGFLAEVCVEWEREAMAAERLGVRVVCVRTGIVLGRSSPAAGGCAGSTGGCDGAARCARRGGGALGRMLTPFRFGVGGRLGSGRQWMPWIHLDDVVGIMLHACREEGVRGAINAVGPRPVTNAELTRALGRALHRPAILPQLTWVSLVFGKRALRRSVTLTSPGEAMSPASAIPAAPRALARSARRTGRA